MHRDMNLVREIMLIAANKTGLEPIDQPSIEGYSEELVQYHIELLIDADLLDGVKRHSTNRGTQMSSWSIAVPTKLGNLTWAGQDFVDAAKDPSLWQRAMNTVIMPTAGFTFGLLVDYLRSQIKKRLLPGSDPAP